MQSPAAACRAPRLAGCVGEIIAERAGLSAGEDMHLPASKVLRQMLGRFVVPIFSFISLNRGRSGG